MGVKLERRAFIAGALALPAAARGLTKLPDVEFKDGALVACRNGYTFRCDTLTIEIGGRAFVLPSFYGTGPQKMP